MLFFNIGLVCIFAFPERSLSSLFYMYLLTITCSRLTDKNYRGALGGKRFELVPRRAIRRKMTAIKAVAVPFRAFQGLSSLLNNYNIKFKKKNETVSALWKLTEKVDFWATVQSYQCLLICYFTIGNFSGKNQFGATPSTRDPETF